MKSLSTKGKMGRDRIRNEISFREVGTQKLLIQSELKWLQVPGPVKRMVGIRIPRITLHLKFKAKRPTG
jgi:hypothetical protein